VHAFIDCINRGDVPGLARLMTDNHVLVVFDEPPLVGRESNIEAWRGYATSFPSYTIYPHHVAVEGERVAVLGSTTGSHLGLSDEDEKALTLIWVADISDERVRAWRLIEDNATNRTAFGLEPA
jgi:ketosteroid isomerase-like protein